MKDENEPETLPLTVADLRPSVVAMAIEMERKLRANAHKGSRADWRKDPPHRLIARAIEETRELLEAARFPARARDAVLIASHHLDCATSELHRFGQYLQPVSGKPAEIRAEAADVCNMLLMFADALGAYDLPDSAE